MWGDKKKYGMTDLTDGNIKEGGRNMLGTVIKFKWPIHLTTFNMRILHQKRQAALVGTLDILQMCMLSTKPAHSIPT